MKHQLSGRLCRTCPDLDSIGWSQDGVIHTVWAQADCRVVHAIECAAACVCTDGKHYLEMVRHECDRCEDMANRIVDEHERLAREEREAAEEAVCPECRWPQCQCDAMYEARRDARSAP